MRYDSLMDLPPELRKRVKAVMDAEDAKNARKNGGIPGKGATAEKIGTQDPGGTQEKNKYGNRVTYVDGVRFDSKREAERYTVLLVRLNVGEISHLKLQPEFTILEAYTKPSGEKVRAQRYRADFSYVLPDGSLVVEDVKTDGTRTRVFENKRKLVEDKYGIEIRLV